MKKFKLTLLNRSGEVIDSTVLLAENRQEALGNARRLLLFQGLNTSNFKLRLDK